MLLHAGARLCTNTNLILLTQVCPEMAKEQGSGAQLKFSSIHLQPPPPRVLHSLGQKVLWSQTGSHPPQPVVQRPGTQPHNKFWKDSCMRIFMSYKCSGIQKCKHKFLSWICTAVSEYRNRKRPLIRKKDDGKIGKYFCQWPATYTTYTFTYKWLMRLV